MTMRPLVPSPKIARPPLMRSREAMLWAISAGVRLYTVTIPVPSPMRSVWPASIVSTVKASRPQDSPVQNDA